MLFGVGTELATIEALTELVESIASPYVHTGSYRPRHPFALRFTDGTTVSLSRDDNTDLEKLAARAAPAPFGDGRATRYDDEIRKARQLKAANAFTTPRFDPVDTGILESVRATLAPQAGRLTAYLDSVQLYTEGGHFVAHRDTPRGAQMLGTLVVCLPVPFRGGALTLLRGSQRETIEWDRAIAKQKHPNEVHWAAFFGDVEHAVERVTKGTRVTVTYALFGAGARKRPRTAGRDAAIRGRELARKLRSAIDDPEFLPEGGTLWWPCLHLYRAEKKQLAARRLASDDLSLLKGRDAIVARAALEARLSTRLIYRLTTNDDDGWLGATWPLETLPLRKWFDELPDELSQDDLEDALSEHVSDARGPYLVGRTGALDYMFLRDFSSTGYFGNEHSETEFYAGAMLEVDVPRPRDR